MRKGIIVIILIILVFMGLTGWGYYSTEFSKKPAIQEKLNTQDVDYLYNFYIEQQPSDLGRLWYGSDDASITLLVYLDPVAESTQHFFNDIWPFLEPYVDDGKIRVMLKYYVTSQDMEEETESFIKAKGLSCIAGTDAEAHLEAFRSGNMSGTCGADLVIEDISEVEQFGMVGISPRFYIGIMHQDHTIIDGIPSWTRLQRVIRTYQTQLGD